jgi:hypothetical protein
MLVMPYLELMFQPILIRLQTGSRQERNAVSKHLNMTRLSVGCPHVKYVKHQNGAWHQWRLVVAQLKLCEMVIEIAREHTALGFRVQEQGMGVSRKQGESFCLLVAYTGDSLTLKKEAVRRYETSVNLYQTTRHHIAEDSGLHGYRHGNFKAKISQFVFTDFLKINPDCAF